MGLSYHFSFSAPASATVDQLFAFLKGVEEYAKQQGFEPTMVLKATFDTPERSQFARRFTTGLRLEDENLKGVIVLRENQVWGHDPIAGACRVMPLEGVLLVVTDERRSETVFGFLKFPKTLKDLNGREVIETRTDGGWEFHSFVDSPDPRYRAIVKLFAGAGYVDHERDEFIQ